MQSTQNNFHKFNIKWSIQSLLVILFENFFFCDTGATINDCSIIRKNKSPLLFDVGLLFMRINSEFQKIRKPDQALYSTLQSHQNQE